MLYYSTNHQSPSVNFREATIKGKPSDNGLYFPEQIPILSEDFIKNIDQFSEEEIAYEVIYPYVKNTIPATELVRIIVETINFKIPAIKISNTTTALELFHGPTLTFKDIGAKFMSLCIEYFLQQEDKKIIVLAATSGDAGGAIAKAFYDIDGIEVVILYPADSVNMIQEKQITSLGNNIHALQIAGNFEECREMVKQVFFDKELNKKINLTSSGSSNVARWLSQQFYYFFAYKQWADKERPPVMSVPSGNFGNIAAGLLAYKSGLPIHHFIAACNANDVIPEFLRTGKYYPKKTITTISNSMDVGNPRNFLRILELFNHHIADIKKILSSDSITDSETKSTIKSFYEKTGYLLDPYGALAYAALQKYFQQHPNSKGIIFKTAHPVKFYEVIEPIIEEPTRMPAAIELELAKGKIYRKMKADTTQLKDFLLSL